MFLNNQYWQLSEEWIENRDKYELVVEVQGRVGGSLHQHDGNWGEERWQIHWSLNAVKFGATKALPWQIKHHTLWFLLASMELNWALEWQAIKLKTPNIQELYYQLQVWNGKLIQSCSSLTLHGSREQNLLCFPLNNMNIGLWNIRNMGLCNTTNSKWL